MEYLSTSSHLAMWVYEKNKFFVYLICKFSFSHVDLKIEKGSGISINYVAVT